MVNITFYGAVAEIGSNKILFEDEDSRILLDFGMTLASVKATLPVLPVDRECQQGRAS